MTKRTRRSANQYGHRTCKGTSIKSMHWLSGHAWRGVVRTRPRRMSSTERDPTAGPLPTRRRHYRIGRVHDESNPSGHRYAGRRQEKTKRTRRLTRPISRRSYARRITAQAYYQTIPATAVTKRTRRAANHNSHTTCKQRPSIRRKKWRREPMNQLSALFPGYPSLPEKETGSEQNGTS